MTGLERRSRRGSGRGKRIEIGHGTLTDRGASWRSNSQERYETWVHVVDGLIVGVVKSMRLYEV